VRNYRGAVSTAPTRACGSIRSRSSSRPASPPWSAPSSTPPPDEAQFTAQRYFALDGTDHRNHRAQASMIRRYIIWRNQHAQDQRLKRIVDRANVA